MSKWLHIEMELEWAAEWPVLCSACNSQICCKVKLLCILYLSKKPFNAILSFFMHFKLGTVFFVKPRENLKETLLPSQHVFPSFQGSSTIFDNEYFHS